MRQISCSLLPFLLTDPQKDPVLYLFAGYLDNHGGLPAFGNSRKAEAREPQNLAFMFLSELKLFSLHPGCVAHNPRAPA